MAQAKKILIVGCGWLGETLAISLLNDFEVHGTTTSVDKYNSLKKRGIIPYIYNTDLPTNSKILENEYDVVVFNIPPSKAKLGLLNAIQQLESIIEMAGRFVFVSSTSVYASDAGVVNEFSETHPESLSGNELLRCENWLQDKIGDKLVIIRPAGLMGPGRHPGMFFKSGSPTFNKEEVVNFIDRNSLVSLVTAVLSIPNFKGVLNAVLPHHPIKWEFYDRAFAVFNRSVMSSFSQSTVKKNKVVDSARLHEFSFKYTETNLFKQLSLISEPE